MGDGNDEAGRAHALAQICAGSGAVSGVPTNR